MTILSSKYAKRLISSGKAVRQYAPLACITKERQLDKIYAVLRREDANGNIRFDHYVA